MTADDGTGEEGGPGVANYAASPALRNGASAEDDGTGCGELARAAVAEMEALLLRGRALLDELRDFQDLVSARRMSTVPGICGLAAKLKTEMANHESELGAFKMLLLKTSPAPLSTPTPTDSREDDASAVVEGAAKRLLNRHGCSNIPSLGTLWGVIKRCRGLVAVSRRFPLMGEEGGGGPKKKKGQKGFVSGENNGRGRRGERRGNRSKDMALADAVLDGGALWLRVLGITRSRLLNDMAVAGWDWDGDDASDDDDIKREEEGEPGDDGDDDEGEVPVIRIVKHLVEAARHYRHNYAHPRLHVVFTRVVEGADPEIDRLLRKLRGLGGGHGGIEVVVDGASSPFFTRPAPPPPEALDNLLRRTTPEALTDVVNLDCSTLMALVSEISHGDVAELVSRRPDISKQIDDEREQRSGDGGGGGLRNVLYPLLCGRTLVCVKAVADRVREIIAMLGTEREAVRASILLDPEVRPPADFMPSTATITTTSAANRPSLPPSTTQTEEEAETGASSVRARMQELSVHPVPFSLRLPVRVLDAEMDEANALPALVASGSLPAAARALVPDPLEDVNREAFLFGWAGGITTVTANDTLARQLRRRIEEEGKEEKGPEIFVHFVRRSLGARKDLVLADS